MNIGAGWIIAFGCAIYGFIWLGGHIEQLWVPQEYLIIFGAALGTLMASNKWRNLKSMFRAFFRIFMPSNTGKTSNLGLLCLMFELLQRIKRDGALSIESDISDPKQSELFAKYPSVLKSERLIEFITDYFRMMMDGTVTLGQLESVIGVVHALTSIKTGIGPGEIGDMIAAALVGTLMGVFSAYAMMLPISRSMEQLAAADLKPFEAVKEILIANYSNFSPMIAVEYGRKVMFTDQRPTMTELSEGVMATSGNKLTG